MWGFRVELLHAEALPLHLLDSLKPVFESNDPLVRKAAESHREQLEKHLEFIRGLDYYALINEWNYWMELFNNRLRDRRRLDPKKYFSLANQIESFEGAYVLLNARFFSLVAIGLLASGSSRDEAISFLDGQSWSTKHEVLTRWGWIKRQNELLKSGIKLAAPYSCSLAPQGAAYEQDDEEFYQLLLFLHLLRFTAGRELLFFEKRQTPDFILQSEDGRLVGAEMTEAWTSPAWTKEFIASSQTLRFLDQHLQHLGAPVHITIETPRSWRSLRKRRVEVAEWIISKIIDIGIPTEKGMPLQNPDLNLNIKISPAERRPSISYGSFASSGPKLLDATKQSEAMHASLQERILNKIKTPVPMVRPCYLVVHPVHDLDIDMERVVAEFFQHSTPDVSSHFSEVWLVGEEYIIQLI